MGQDTEAAAEVSEVEGLLLERGNGAAPIAEEPSEPKGSGFQLRAASKLGVVMAGLSAVCLVAVICTKPAMIPNFEMLTQAGRLISMEAAMALDASLGQCTDTPSWSNGYYQCNTNGYTGIGCVANGFTCEAYAANGLCVGGAKAPGKEWAFGESLNFPELNCCACGGGSGLLAGSTTAAALMATLPTTTTTSYDPPKTAMCAAYSKCTDLSGNCCPGDSGIDLSCCAESELVCFDAPAWTNGYIKCSKYGFSEEEGCTAGGVTCAGYVNQSFCADGKVLEGKEWTMGGRFNHPELNCCACGKSASGNIGNAVW